MSTTKSALIELLGAIRHRPGMYVGDEVHDLGEFLAGFSAGLRYLGHDDTNDDHLLHDFSVWQSTRSRPTSPGHL